MSNPYNVELTDTMGGEPNYSWVRRERVTVPELTHYGYSGSTDGSYAKANRVANRELMRRAKAAVGYRCPQCGYPVDNYFEHIDKDCNSDDAAEAERKGVPYCPPDDEEEA